REARAAGEADVARLLRVLGDAGAADDTEAGLQGVGAGAVAVALVGGAGEAVVARAGRAAAARAGARVVGGARVLIVARGAVVGRPVRHVLARVTDAAATRGLERPRGDAGAGDEAVVRQHREDTAAVAVADVRGTGQTVAAGVGRAGAE